MSRRRELQQHRHTLGEIRDIMNSMKTLAYIESRKLGRFLDAQRAVVAHIETMAADFLGFYAGTLPRAEQATAVLLLLGSERGFCGDFNEALLRQLESHIQENSLITPRLIVTGNKLGNRLEGDPRVLACIDGANVVEEAENSLALISNTLTELQANEGAVSLVVFYHDPDSEQVITAEVLPPFEQYRDNPPAFPHPPLLNLPPAAFLAKLIDHYLFAVLHEIMYVSMMAENIRRVRHLQGAVQHLDDKAANLLHQSNALRQEEIIEEIEVILLSAGSLDERPPERK
ncbi:MAG: FoF1 ATP synthase subunit gamma [Gammaproteobacteria bacterium]|jgi:F-type H+-transporting ATPase subunit gamma